MQGTSLGLSVYILCRVKYSWIAKYQINPAGLNQATWSGILSSAAFRPCWMAWPLDIMVGDYQFRDFGFFNLKYVPRSLIYYFISLCSNVIFLFKLYWKCFSSFTDLSLPFRFSEFYLHRGDPWKSLAVPFISPIQKLQYRYTLCFHWQHRSERRVLPLCLAVLNYNSTYLM